MADEVEELAKKLTRLDLTPDTYAEFHARMVLIAPTVAQYYPPPFRTTAPAHTPPPQPPYPQPPLHAHIHAYGQASTTTYAPRQPWPTPPTINPFPDDGTCHSCKTMGCNVRNCQQAREYVAAGRIIVTDGRYVFPKLTRIRRDTVRGYRGSINDRYGGPLSAPQTSSTVRDVPPHMASTTPIPNIVSLVIYIPVRSRR